MYRTVSNAKMLDGEKNGTRFHQEKLICRRDNSKPNQLTTLYAEPVNDFQEQHHPYLVHII